MMVNIFSLTIDCFLSMENKEQKKNPLLIQSILEYTSMVNTHAVLVDVK